MATIAEKKPRYLALADMLRAGILDGRYADPGFPTESILCDQHGVSRFTVREALRKLQSEGLIKRRRGSGTVVQPAAARAGALHQPLSNVDEILQYARDTRFTFERRGVGRLPRRHAEQIGVDADVSWFRFRGLRTRTGDDVPIAATDAYVHRDLAQAAARIDTSEATIFKQLEELSGVPVARVTQDIQAVLASADIAAQLGIARRAACLRIMRCYIDESGRVFEISVSHHPGDRFAYAMHIEVDGEG